MSRSADTYVAKEDRVKRANSVSADIYVSIHQNFSEVKSVNGMEVWYDGTDTQRDSRRLALLVSQQTARNTGAVEREVRGDADFHVTGSTEMPSCLVETGFLSNKEECAKLASQEYQEKIASGIVQGIEYYFHPKTMYLTFDDGPSENTSRVLDILKEKITTVICHATIQQNSAQDVKEQEQRVQNQKTNAVHETFGETPSVAPENKTSATIEKPEWNNISRNDPCPCGSGKKYKHCHGKVA